MNPQQVIVTQPQVMVVQRQQSQWQSGLCDCCSDCGVCTCPADMGLPGFCGMFCYMCLGCEVAADMSECCLCGTSWAMRSVYRTRYGIQGSMFDDFCTALWCPVCSLCQIKRDINRRRQLGIF